MSDYQAVYNATYDAIRSRIGNADIGEVARQCFDVSFATHAIKETFCDAAASMMRPSVLFRPNLSLDGNRWIALYGDNLQDGVAGCGVSPDEAMRDFDINWHKSQGK